MRERVSQLTAVEVGHCLALVGALVTPPLLGKRRICLQTSCCGRDGQKRQEGLSHHRMRAWKRLAERSTRLSRALTGCLANSRPAN